jgi:hypothetical protein
MELWFAELAIVLLGQGPLVDQTHAATVLPDRAPIALDEEIAEVFTEGFED